MKKTIAIFFVLLSGMLQAQKLKTHTDSVSYALGVSMSESLAKSGIKDYDLDTFIAAIRAHQEGKTQMDAKTADQIYRAESKKIAEEKNKVAQKASADFLEANKTKPGVITTASGLQYKTIVEGTGASPLATDKVTVHYHGTLIDGFIFDSSVDRGTPATFGLNQVITGWTEGLQLMKEGGKTTFYVPYSIGYGAQGKGKVPPFATMIFDIELIKVEKAPMPNMQPGNTATPKPTPTPTPTPKPTPGVTPTPTPQPNKKG
ncbi:MAG: FKBP-type peptidyl-prolyl cis-trans isomerase [Flavobacteriales bacterium]